MKKLLLILSIAPLSIFTVKSQDTLFSENFESGNQFALNTTDLSGTTGGANLWVLNSTYTGGTYTLSCLGFGVPAPNTSAQPNGITNAPNSPYLHITNAEAEAAGFGTAHYIASDGGSFCVSDENYFTKMATDINTTGKTNVALSFYWLCQAAPGTNYGEVYYSTDGGNTWTQCTTPQANYEGQSTWTQTNISNPNFDNQATLRFGFRFVNVQINSANDPSFAVDEINVTAPQSLNITENYDMIFCENADSVKFDYTSTGITFNPGNEFTLELSDNSGDFSASTSIANVTSTANSGSIYATLPNGVSGTGYLVRILSDNPSIVGDTTDNTLTINSAVDTSVTATESDFTANATGVNYQWYNCDSNAVIAGETNQQFTPNVAGNYAVIVTDNSGVCTDTSYCYYNNAGVGLTSAEQQTFEIYPNPAQEYLFIQGIPNNKKYSIVSITGKEVMNGVLSNKIDINTLTEGIYFISIKFESRVTTKKIVKIR